MTYATITAHPASALRRLGAALVDGLDFIATLGPRTEALRRLSATSDAQLAARHTTRDAEVRRIVGVTSYT